MKTFKYTALDGQSKKHKGTLRAPSSGEARAILRARSLHPVQVSPSRGGGFLPPLPFVSNGSKLWYGFFDSMHTLSTAGNTIVESLNIISQSKSQTAGKQAQTANEIKTGLNAGKTFSQTIRTTSTPLPAVYVAMLEYAEKSGALAQTFQLISKDCRRKLELTKKVKAMAAYPIVVTVLALCVIVFQFAYVLPSYMQIYNQMHSNVPRIIGFLMQLAQTPATYWKEIVLSALILALALAAVLRRNYGAFASTLLKVPLLGNIWACSFKLNIFGSLAIMTNSGVPFAKALKALSQNNPAHSASTPKLRTILSRVEEGRKIWEAFDGIEPFESFETQNLKVAQQSGNLPASLNFIAGRNEEMLNESVGVLTGFLEPAITVATGVLVALVALSFLIPVYYFTGSIK